MPTHPILAATAAGAAVKDCCSQALEQLQLSTPASELTMLEEWELFSNIKGEEEITSVGSYLIFSFTIVFKGLFLMKRLLNSFLLQH